MRKLQRMPLLLLIALTVSHALTGCGSRPAVNLEPQVSPPAVQTSGVLLAGVDLSTPPFAGIDGGRKAGLDVDVAAAIAERLGLTVEYVDVAPADAADALAEGRVDVVFSIPIATADLSRIAPAGTYVLDGPGVFVSADDEETVVTPTSLPSGPIAVQNESESYWMLTSEVGPESLKPYDTLREALLALQDGEVRFVAGDSLIGAYIARDMPGVRFAGQITEAAPVAAAVAPDNSELSEAVRLALDELAADGVLTSVRRKWVGELPDLAASPADQGLGSAQ
jgi:polar amino acid transport system substrate-binding protein